MEKVKVLIVDKHEIFRKGLAIALESVPGIEPVVDGFMGWEDAIRKHQPDVLLIDPELSEDNDIEVIRRISKTMPKTKVVVLTHSEVEASLFQALGAGARAYVCKDTNVENLIRTINFVAEGNIVISSTMAEILLAKFSPVKVCREIAKPEDGMILTEREKTVLSLVEQGLTNRKIATTLYISEHTVKVHMRNIMEKLRAHTRQQAVVLAKQKHKYHR